MEALLNFQTMIMDLTGFEIANASLLDEGTAAAEAMAMAYAARGKGGNEVCFVADSCQPQTIDVVRTRAQARGLEMVAGDFRNYRLGDDAFGGPVPYGTSEGGTSGYRD